MKILTYQSLTDIKRREFFAFLKSTQQNNSPANVNMWDDMWQLKKETLPYLLEKTDRFDEVNGAFHILYDNQIPVACGGVYVSAFSKFTGIAGVRTWVDPAYRHRAVLREHMLPLHKQWCHARHLKIVALTFNQYNKNLIQIFKRRRLGETNTRIDTRKSHHLFFNGLCEVPFLVNVQYTPQWLIYEQLDPVFNFDWTSIRVDSSSTIV
jgi:hypothetical protein